MQEAAKKYCNNIIEAMETETETDCLICQAQALKELLDEAGINLLKKESVEQFHGKVWEFLEQSERRISDNNKYEKENECGGDDEDDGLDEEDLLVLKEENKNEY
jgi:hypothetical protein